MVAVTFLGVIPYLVACVINNLVWLRENLPDYHEFWQCNFCNGGWITPGHERSLLKEDGVLLGQTCVM